MERTTKTEETKSVGQEKDVARSVAETVDSELSENELHDINGGCCNGQHMPTTI